MGAAKEAAYLLERCEEDERLSECRLKIENERYIRSQDIGKGIPSPGTLAEGIFSTWTLTIRSTNAEVTPGQSGASVPAAPGQPQSGSTPLEDAITYTKNTCFALTYNPDEFEVEKDKVCPEYRGEPVPYIAQWRVKPLKDGEFPLTVKALHQIGDIELTRIVPTDPVPFKVKVVPRQKGWIEEIDLLTAVLVAIGGLIGAIWGILKFFKRPKDEDTPAPPAARTPKPPAS
ncbi:MAG: hypothetical protein AAFP79_05695 [Pseudomonadota bacterium]